jgi:hypothetical protein
MKTKLTSPFEPARCALEGSSTPGSPAAAGTQVARHTRARARSWSSPSWNLMGAQETEASHLNAIEILYE